MQFFTPHRTSHPLCGSGFNHPFWSNLVLDSEFTFLYKRMNLFLEHKLVGWVFVSKLYLPFCFVWLNKRLLKIVLYIWWSFVFYRCWVSVAFLLNRFPYAMLQNESSILFNSETMNPGYMDFIVQLQRKIPYQVNESVAFDWILRAIHSFTDQDWITFHTLPFPPPPTPLIHPTPSTYSLIHPHQIYIPL